MPHNFSIAKYLNVICKPGERALLEIRQEMSERGNDTLFGGRWSWGGGGGGGCVALLKSP